MGEGNINSSAIFCKFMKKKYKKDIPFYFTNRKARKTEALGPSKNCTLLLNYPIPNSQRSSQGMDVHGDSSKTLLEKVVCLVL